MVLLHQVRLHHLAAVRDPGRFTANFNPTALTPTDRKSFDNGAYVTWYDRT